MFDEIRERIFKFITSRMTILTLVMVCLGGILIYRCFQLQIVQGQEYLDKFILQTEKTRDLASTRGNIMDCNGKVLAYNELAYSVKIEDVFETNKNKNKNMNETIFRLIQMIEKNGDHVITDFGIVLDENNEFSYNVEGTSLLRFLADVYGYKTIDELKTEQRMATADEVIDYLGGTKRFAIGDYEEEGNSRSDFLVGKGYSKEDLLKMVIIRYAMNLTSFQKYIGTIVAKDVSDETVAIIMENQDILDGVSIEDDTVRRYVDSEYFAHILGYTGKISSEELRTLNEEAGKELYNINDVVGKSGIESYMETILQGTKGYEKVSVDNMGKVISILEREEARAGDNIKLTIDADLQIAVYHILEQRIAGIVADKIIDAKEYIPGTNASSSDIRIPIYDVYFAMIDNSILDMDHFAASDAGETEREVYEKYLDYQTSAYDRLREELLEKKTPYNKLSKEYQVYQSNIVSMLNKNGIIISDAVNADDPMQTAWAVDEVISLNEYLNYVIAQNWIAVSNLNMEEKYSNDDEIYQNLVEYIIRMVDGNVEFQKKLYKYMLLNNVITGKQICILLCEQNAVEIPIEEEEMLYAGKISAYNFMMNRINNLDITPAQLALDPCNGSAVITDVNNGNVLAMVTYPGYDNNKMANSVDAEYYSRLMTDKSKPSLNYATQNKAAPGSTIKMMMATLGLSEGYISLGSKVNCLGTYPYADSPRCWKIWGHGNENVTTAIRDSCNYFFYDLGYRMATRSGSYNEEEALNQMKQYADLFGLTEKSGVEITESSPDFTATDPVRSAIGQGSHSYTVAGIARYITTVANSGNCYDLTLLDSVVDASGNTVTKFEPKLRNTVDMPQEYWNAIHFGMRQMVENKAYFSDLSVNVAGKTGTAEQTKSRPNHALFVGYAPYENPEIAIALRIPFGYTSDYAAQTTRDIIMYHYGLAEEEELITHTADAPDAGVNTNEF